MKIVLVVTKIIVFCGCIILSGGCRIKDRYASVLTHFKNDSLKYNAASFLISNIDSHFTINERYINANRKNLTDFIGSYPGELDRAGLMDSLQAHIECDTIPDRLQVNSEFLIHHVDEAFRLWHSGPPGLKVCFRDFCQYMLPYRIGNEPLCNWRGYFKDRYCKLLQVFGDSLDVKTIVNFVNEENGGWFIPAPRNSSYPRVTPGLKQLLTLKSAWDCTDYAYLQLYIFRSLGIPAAYEIIPLYGKFNHGHSETSVLYENGRFYPAIADTVAFKYMIAKMYRISYSQQPSMASGILETGEKMENIPADFFASNLIDITCERTDVSDIRVPVRNALPGQVFYICVYNSGQWRPVDWGCFSRSDSSVKFRDMGRKILYHTASMVDGQLILNEGPLVLDTTGIVTPVVCDPGHSMEMTIQKYDRHQNVITGQDYYLYIWNEASHEWQRLSKSKSKSGQVGFDNVPSAGLYKVEPADREVGEDVRIFTYKNEKQIWW